MGVLDYLNGERSSIKMSASASRRKYSQVRHDGPGPSSLALG
jgi:hypothetical protein